MKLKTKNRYLIHLVHPSTPMATALNLPSSLAAKRIRDVRAERQVTENAFRTNSPLPAHYMVNFYGAIKKPLWHLPEATDCQSGPSLSSAHTCLSLSLLLPLSPESRPLRTILHMTLADTSPVQQAFPMPEAFVQSVPSWRWRAGL
ncbi:hypothetical protein XELAEV_18002440mg [Xenopus laevis]|uniref:Uncharacterized protein n=1 Tax=Xenopus laevis TaxID=8355 RepID=A0A974BQ25_XENLA|nr:hypothetical protein XELAEV_18002440mg [Xenopus laevis]